MPDSSIYFVVPFLTGLIGWSTNWLGVKMMIYPKEFVGFWFIGWQGIIPRLRVRLTRDVVRHSIEMVCTPEEMLQAINDADAIAEITRIISPEIRLWVDEILSEQYGNYWDLAPRTMRLRVYRMLEQQIPEFSKSLLDEIRKKANRYVDIQEIAAQEAERQPGILTDLVMAMAQEEIRFIVRSGLFIGIPLGCIQATVWYFYPHNWVLPIFGLLVGAFTNWLALQILMFPGKPRRFLWMEFQGLFIKRQPVVAVDFTRAFVHNFLEVRNVFNYVWRGERSDEVQKLVQRQFRKTIQKQFMGANIYRLLKSVGNLDEIDPKTMSRMEETVLSSLENTDVTHKLLEPVGELLSDRIGKLEPHEFQGLLLPIFEQDKWLMIGVGGALGFLAGTAQLVYLFGGSLY